jgi:hypothetical protein
MNKQIDKREELSHPKIWEAKQMRVIVFEQNHDTTKGEHGKNGSPHLHVNLDALFKAKAPHRLAQISNAKSPMNQGEPVAVACQRTHCQLNTSSIPAHIYSQE